MKRSLKPLLIATLTLLVSFAGHAKFESHAECVREIYPVSVRELIEDSYSSSNYSRFKFDYRCEVRDGTGEFTFEEYEACRDKRREDALADAERYCTDYFDRQITGRR